MEYKRLIDNAFASHTKQLPYIQIIATVTMIVYASLLPQTTWMWLGSIAMYVMIGCFGISIGYHRLLTHKSFKTSKFWEYFCTFWGMLAFTGSSIGWVGMHRDHHKYSDRPGDPHSPHEFGAKMLLAVYPYQPDKWKIRHMIFDPVHVFTHKWYYALLLVWIAAWYLFTGIIGVMHIVIIPAVISVWISTTSNYMNHMWGYINFPTTDKSRNLWINALVTFGEGWHNNHHARPGNYDFGSGTSGKWWEWDIGARVIELIRK